MSSRPTEKLAGLSSSHYLTCRINEPTFHFSRSAVFAAIFLAHFVIICSIFDIIFIDASPAKLRHHSLPLNHFELFRPHEQLKILVVKPGRTGGQLGSYNQIYSVSFHALGREFHLLLTLSPMISSNNIPVYSHGRIFQSEIKNGQRPTNFASVAGQHFSGYVAKHKHSSDVVISILNGKPDIQTSVPAITNSTRVFASIYASDEHYYIEPFHDTNDTEHLQASHIIYRASDVLHPPVGESSRQTKLNGYCGLNTPLFLHSNETSSTRQNKRVRRNSFADESIKNFINCPLLLVADHHFFRTVGGNDTSQTINYLINIVERVNLIFRRTNFAAASRGGGRFSGMGFSIKGIIVDDEPEKSSTDLHYNMPDHQWTVQDLLTTFSTESFHENYCLSHLFTDQVLDDSIVGLAYVAFPNNQQAGGICSDTIRNQAVHTSDGKRIHPNTGLSSVRNSYGRQMTTRQAELVFAHELAHNWGALHDPDVSECNPSSGVSGGSYVMHTYTVSGLDPNNRHFSPCSLSSMSKVLRERASSCFDSRFKSLCGNSIVESFLVDDDGYEEPGEECDGGFNANDKCCTSSCQLRGNTECSDRNNVCCKNCRIVRAEERRICARGSIESCTADSYCSGETAECPPSIESPDGTPCANNGKCRNGTCVPYCEALTKPHRSCQCSTVEYACIMCCQQADSSSSSECRPAPGINVLPLPDGTPCMRGYCRDARCEQVVQADSLSRWWLKLRQRYPHHSLLWQFVADNVVMLVLVLSLLICVPLAMLVHKHDKLFVC